MSFLGAIFFKSKHGERHFCSYFQGVCSNLQGVYEGFQRFCPDFHQIKTFGGVLVPLHPRLLHQWRETSLIIALYSDLYLALFKSCTRSATSNRNCLPRQKSCHYLNEVRTLN